MAQRPRHTPWPSTVILRWRWEIALLAMLGVIGWAAAHPPARPLLACLVIGAAALLALPSGRDWLVRHGWAIVVQHRIRVACSEAALHGRGGQLPAVLWTRITLEGERLYLWLPAGVTIRDFIAEQERLAVACWADSVQTRRHPRRAQLVILDVVRYPRPGGDTPESDRRPAPPAKGSADTGTLRQQEQEA